MKPVVSVIIPIYNIEQYVTKCVESVLNQSVSGMQIILVDDGSTDASGKICDSFAESNSEIVTIHKKNGGLSSARNAGLDSATGEYISFIDGDDQIESTMLEKMIDAINTYNSDMAVCGYKDYDLNGRCVEHCRASDVKALNQEDSLMYFFTMQISQSVCDKVFKRELFDDLRFMENTISEDIEVLPRLLLKCEKIIIVPYSFYHYIHRRNSITTTEISKQGFSVLNRTRFNVELIHKVCPHVEKAAYAFDFEYEFSIMFQIYDAGFQNEYKYEIKDITKYIRQNFKNYFFNKYVNIYWRIYSIFIILGIFDIYYKCYRMKRKIGGIDRNGIK